MRKLFWAVFEWFALFGLSHLLQATGAGAQGDIFVIIWLGYYIGRSGLDKIIGKYIANVICDPSGYWLSSLGSIQNVAIICVALASIAAHHMFPEIPFTTLFQILTFGFAITRVKEFKESDENDLFFFS